MRIIDPTTRFSNRVENYIRYRPRYPEEVIRILGKEFGLTTESVIADIGSGTGISSGLFLHNFVVAGQAFHWFDQPTLPRKASRDMSP